MPFNARRVQGAVNAKFLKITGIDTLPVTVRAKAKSSSKSKYTCDGCLQNAWAKLGAHLMCGDCNEPMTYNPGR